VEQFKRYSLRSFVDDFISALTIAFILLPQSIAYAGLAEADPTQALISASFPPLLYFIFGSSRQLSIGPEALVSVVVGTTISNEIELNPDSKFTKLQISAALTLVVGILSILLAILRAGFVDNILSGYLLTGFVLGTSNLIIVEQLPDLFGLKVEVAGDDSTINKLITALNAFSTAHKWTIIISILNIVFLLSFREFKKRFKGNRILARIPEILILVVVMIIVSFTVDLESKGVHILGEFENRIRKPTVPPFKRDLIGRLIQPAITIVLVGYIECQTVTRDFGLRFGYFPSGDQELFALGVTNVVTSFLGGYPTFGSLPRSRIMASAGAKTTLASAMSGLFVLIFFLTLVPALQFLPRATLASIVFVAALGLIETREIGFVFRLRAWTEIAMFLATYVITLVFSISVGILLCLGLSALLIVKRTTITSMSVMGRVSHHHLLVPSGPSGKQPRSFDGLSSRHSPFVSTGVVSADNISVDRKKDQLPNEPQNPPAAKPTFVNIDEHPDAELLDGVILLRVDVPLLFYNSGQARRSIEAVLQAEKRLAMARYRRRMQRRKKDGRRQRGEGTGKAVGDLSDEGRTGSDDEEEEEDEENEGQRRRKERSDLEIGGEGGRSVVEEEEYEEDLNDDDLPPLSPIGGSDDEGDDDTFDAEAGRRWGALHRWRKNRGRAAPLKTSTSTSSIPSMSVIAPSSTTNSGVTTPTMPQRTGGIFGKRSNRPSSTSSSAHLLLASPIHAGSSSSILAPSSSAQSPTAPLPANDAGDGFDDVALKPLNMSSVTPTMSPTDPSLEANPIIAPKPSNDAPPAGFGYGGPHTIVLDMRHCIDLDSAATFVLRRIVRNFRGQGIRVVFCGVQPFQRILFQRAGLAPVLLGNVFEDMAAAVADVEAKIEVVEWRRDE
ncbi:Solute carrier 26, partial [Dinochytrium kinnereticum]